MTTRTAGARAKETVEKQQSGLLLLLKERQIHRVN